MLVHSAFAERLGYHLLADHKNLPTGSLIRWLPVYRAHGAAWLVLETPIQRAVPEEAVQALQACGIQPILHIDSSAGRLARLFANPRQAKSLFPIFQSYARWGVHLITISNTPNLRNQWETIDWIQGSPVERFLDIFLNIAEQAWEAGLTPVFPPLAIEGNYPHTAFLRQTYHGLRQRLQSRPYLLHKLGVAMHLPSGASLQTEAAGQLETILAEAEAALGLRPPLLLFEVQTQPPQAKETDEQTCMELPSEVIACCFRIPNFNPMLTQPTNWHDACNRES